MIIPLALTGEGDFFVFEKRLAFCTNLFIFIFSFHIGNEYAIIML